MPQQTEGTFLSKLRELIHQHNTAAQTRIDVPINPGQYVTNWVLGAYDDDCELDDD